MVELDRIDEKILSTLSGDGRISITDLAKTIGLSKTPTQLRVKRLEAEGIISGYRAVLDPIKLGRDHVAFVEIRLTDSREPALKAFNEAVLRIPEVEECYILASQFDYLLKVRTRGMRDYREILGGEISALPYVSHTSTHVAMQAVKESGAWEV